MAISDLKFGKYNEKEDWPNSLNRFELKKPPVILSPSMNDQSLTTKAIIVSIYAPPIYVCHTLFVFGDNLIQATTHSLPPLGFEQNDGHFADGILPYIFLNGNFH